MKRLIAGLVVTLVPLHSFAECHFKTENVIFCTDPTAAVVAYQRFGFDKQLTFLSYNQQLLHQAGCQTPYVKTFKQSHIEQMNHGKIATSSGWENVSTLVINHHDIGYIASDYIAGVCQKYVPPTYIRNEDGTFKEVPGRSKLQ